MMLRSTLVAAALLLAAGPVAAAEPAVPPQSLVHDLSVGGKPVGTRELTIRYQSRPEGERRVLEAYTVAEVAGQKLVCRSSGQAGPRGATFTSSVDTGGSISQVQGAELPVGGWRLFVADGAGVKESLLGRDDVRLSSLDLLDPGRNARLAGGGALELLLVETGEVMVGTLSEGQPATVRIGGEDVAVTRYVATGALGEAIFDIDGTGLLLRSEMRWLGVALTAAARSVPPPRSFGTLELAPAAGISEQSL